MPEPHVLIVASDTARRERLNWAVSSGGAKTIVHERPEQLDRPAQRLCVFGWDGDEAELRGLLRRLRHDTHVVGVSPQLPLDRMVRLLDGDACGHLCTDDAPGMTMLTATVAKHVTGDLFGVEKYLPPRTEVGLVRLRDFQGRSTAIDEVLDYADQAGVRSRVRGQIAQVCEELLMNALYDAPVDAEGRLLFGEVDPRDRVEQVSPRPVSLRYASSPAGFYIAVRDRFGRFDKHTVLRYLAKCLHSKQQIDRKTYGAGLGLYLIANAASSLAVNVAPGMATEVVCAFDRQGARSGLRAFSFFTHPGEPR